jgi:hypothetical protein
MTNVTVIKNVKNLFVNQKILLSLHPALCSVNNVI